MIKQSHKVIFVHIPRTSGTSIEKSLGYRNEYRKHFNALDIRRIVGEKWDDFFKFSIVRNPWDRAVSLWAQPAFKDIGKLSGHSLEYFLRRYAPFTHEHGTTFADYLNYGEMDMIARFEDREEGLKRISERIGIKVDPTVHTKKTQRAPYKEYHTPTTVQMVWDKWGEDAEKYKYSYEG